MASYNSRSRPPRETDESAVLTLNATRNALTIFVLLVFLGFPGTLSKIIGKGPAKMIEYASWGVQFMLVMLASGDDVWNIKLLNLQPSYRIIYLYFVYCSASSMLVVEDRKAVLITLIHLLLTIMFALWLIEAYEPVELMEVFYGAQFLMVAILLVCSVIFPNIVFYNYQGSRTMRGLFATKNEFGTALALGILVQCILLRSRREKGENISLLFIGVMVVQFGMILLSKNMGAILITVGFIAYMLYYGMSENKRRLPLGLLFVAGSIGFLFFAMTILQALSPLLESLGKDASLTGRVPLWEQCITVITQTHTLTGFGYEMFWYIPSAVDLFHSGFAENSWAATSSASSHNMMMELLLNTGFIGIALLILMFVRADRGIKYMDENQYLFCSSYTVMFTIRGFTERQSASGLVYVMLQYVILGLMYQAEFQHKLEIRRKARVYVSEESDSSLSRRRSESDGSDLAAFQQRFSNIASQEKKEKVLPEWHDEWESQEEKRDLLEDLYQELEHNDKDKYW